MQIADLHELRTPTDLTLSPDGSLAVYAVSRADLDADRYESELWLARTDGRTAPRRLTRGHRDSLPRLSPDGRWLAFLRAGDDAPPVPYVLPLDGGEPRRLADPPLGASALAWRPDSAALAFVARVPEPGRYGTDADGERSDAASPAKEPPRRIRDFRYRLDGIGFTLDRPQHVFVVDVDDDTERAPRQLTSGDRDHDAPAWHPDGERLAVVAARHDGAGDDVLSDVWVLSTEPGEPWRVTDTSMPVATPAWAPDGQTIVFRGPGHADPIARNSGIFSVPADGSRPPERLTDAERWDTANAAAAAAQPLLVTDDEVVTVALDRGSAPLMAFPRDGGSPRVLLGGDRVTHGYAMAGEVLVAVVAADVSAGEVVAVRDSEERVLSDVGGPLARTAALRPMTELSAQAPDRYPVHGWLVKPAGTGPFPVLLCIHGGPFAQYGYTLFDEAQVYAGAGYAVVLGNPRGSAGYGEAHGRAIVGDFGALDRDDLLALLDAALTDPDLDAERVGVLGGSYGGFMTSWLVGTTDRFAAAVSERAVNAWDSFLGASDIGWLFAPRYVSEDPAELRRQSPLALAEGVSTPTLLIHSEEDWRCPVEQAQRFYVALKRAGVVTELLLFPGEGHELSRSGLPSHRVARFEAILDWFDTHLRG